LFVSILVYFCRSFDKNVCKQTPCFVSGRWNERTRQDVVPILKHILSVSDDRFKAILSLPYQDRENVILQMNISTRNPFQSIYRFDLRKSFMFLRYSPFLSIAWSLDIPSSLSKIDYNLGLIKIPNLHKRNLSLSSNISFTMISSTHVSQCSLFDQQVDFLLFDIQHHDNVSSSGAVLLFILFMLYLLIAISKFRIKKNNKRKRQ
jgi:hypothetical protein